MRGILIIALVVSGAIHAAGNDYEEIRELSLDSRGIDTLSVGNGSGSIDIVGVANASEISITATLVVPGGNEDKARKRIEEDLRLTLRQDSDTAVLVAYFERGGWFNWNDEPSVSLEIRMPENMHLAVDDGSGSIDIDGVRGDILLDDGSGSIELTDVGGQIEIDDGSGSISADRVGGDITVNDGSGSIRIRGVAGSVTVDDGSGSINVSDVEQDLTIIDDGSGGLDFSNIAGRVKTAS
ncbi:MAG: hypothetical protein ACR2Q3_10910 [Woeseiaceae bacterium]